MDEFDNGDDYRDVDDLGICEIRIGDHNSLESPLGNH